MAFKAPVADIFCEVYQLPPEERTRRIAELTGPDEALKTLIYSLIESYEQNPDFLETPVTVPAGEEWYGRQTLVAV